MKKTLIILFLACLYSGKLLSQVNDNKPLFRTDTCAALMPYSGNWIYTSGTDTIKMHFTYHRSIDTATNLLIDRLWGFFEFKRGTQVIFSNYDDRLLPLPFIINSWPHEKLILGLATSDCFIYGPSFGGTLFYRKNGTHGYTVNVNIININELSWKHYFTGTSNDTMSGNNPPTGNDSMPSQFTLIRQ